MIRVFLGSEEEKSVGKSSKDTNRVHHHLPEHQLMNRSREKPSDRSG